jgi:asparagine synthase (glutamine-hydrolysing)
MKAFTDLLVTFGGCAPAVSRSGGVWQMTGTDDRSPEALWVHRPVPSGCGRLNSLLCSRKTSSWQVWLLGELFEYGTVTRSNALEQWCSDLQDGTERPRDLNGHFLIVARNEHDGTWHAWTDRLGTLHLYYATDGRRAAFGTFSPAVAAAASSRSLDLRGLTGCFAFGFFPEDRTFFEDVRVTRPATHVTWDRDGRKTHESRYWQWSYDPDRTRSYSDTVDAFGDTLEAILRDQTADGRIAIPLSGGLDSRTIAAVATASGRLDPAALWSYSYGYTDDSQETCIASRIAAVRQLPFSRFTVGPYLFDRLDTVLASVEGFGTVTTTRQAAVTAEIASHADYLLAAHWGDVWMDDMGVREGSLSEAALVDHVRHKIEKRGGEWLVQHISSRHLGEDRPDEWLRAVVASELRRVGDIGDLDFRVKAFKTDQWSFRWTVPGLRMFQPAAFPRLPFYDNRMVDFCCTVPTEFVAGRRLQIDYLKRHHPDLASVTWQETDSSLFSQQHFNSWLLPKRAAKKLGRLVTGKQTISRNWEVQFFAPGARRRLEQHLLSPGLKLHDLLPRSDVQGLVTEVYNAPSASNGHAVSQLLTLSAWLERYV